MLYSVGMILGEAGTQGAIEILIILWMVLKSIERQKELVVDTDLTNLLFVIRGLCLPSFIMSYLRLEVGDGIQYSRLRCTKRTLFPPLRKSGHDLLVMAKQPAGDITSFPLGVAAATASHLRKFVCTKIYIHLPKY